MHEADGAIAGVHGDERRDPVDLHDPKRLGRGGVIVLAIFMALQQLGIATDIVTTAFAILFGAIAFALALAFGLGNRDLAAEITREWYDRYRRERAEAVAREREENAEGEAEIRAEEAAERARKTPQVNQAVPPNEPKS